MKTFCKVCTIHFQDEFEETLKPPCNYWGDNGMSNMPAYYKKKIWDWLFSLPADEIGEKCNIGISVTYNGVPIEPSDKFENTIPGYVDLTENEKKAFQKDFFKKKLKGENPVNTAKPKKEKIVN